MVTGWRAKVLVAVEQPLGDGGELVDGDGGDAALGPLGFRIAGRGGEQTEPDQLAVQPRVAGELADVVEHVAHDLPQLVQVCVVDHRLMMAARPAFGFEIGSGGGA